MLYRYPLVLLIASEAYIRLGNNTKALSYINQIRQIRILSGSPNQLLSSINKNILREEYACELGLEGHRWFLLKRPGKQVERAQLYGGITTYMGVKSPDGKLFSCRTNIQPYHVSWPIPQSEIDAVGGFPQNEVCMK